jgi:hypothetical protein
MKKTKFDAPRGLLRAVILTFVSCVISVLVLLCKWYNRDFGPVLALFLGVPIGMAIGLVGTIFIFRRFRPWDEADEEDKQQ